MTDTSRHGMDGLPCSQIHAMMKCHPCPRTPVIYVPGTNNKPGDDDGEGVELIGNCPNIDSIVVMGGRNETSRRGLSLAPVGRRRAGPGWRSGVAERQDHHAGSPR